MKIVYNHDAGMFNLSQKALEMIRNAGGHDDGVNIPRNDPLLVKIIELLGDEANGPFASLAIAEIPDDSDWTIFDVDGCEAVISFKHDISKLNGTYNHYRRGQI